MLPKDSVSLPPVIAAGTWTGYGPVVDAWSRRPTRDYRFEAGLSDRERSEALFGGRAAAVLISVQALIGWLKEYADEDLVVIHAFGRSNCADAEDHLLVKEGTHLGMPIRWVIPGDGLEKEVIRRLDPSAVPTRMLSRSNRRDCVQAVTMGEADACMISKQFAAPIITERPGVPIEWIPLPEAIWSDIWVLLIAPRRRVLKNKQAYSGLVRELTEDAVAAQRAVGARIIYLDRKKSLSALSDGTIAASFARWLPPDGAFGSTSYDLNVLADAVE